MKLIKKKSIKTYKTEKGKERHYYNFLLQFDNGKRVLIKAVMLEDVKYLDAVAEYEY